VLSGVVGLLALVVTEEQGASLINFGAFVAFTSVNVSVIATWVRSRASDTPRNAITWLVLPLIGAAFTVGLLVSLETNAKIVGLVWVSIGFVYLLWMTSLFRKLPPSFGEE
jgi:amino acid transporter